MAARTELRAVRAVLANRLPHWRPLAVWSASGRLGFRQSGSTHCVPKRANDPVASPSYWKIMRAPGAGVLLVGVTSNSVGAGRRENQVRCCDFTRCSATISAPSRTACSLEACDACNSFIMFVHLHMGRACAGAALSRSLFITFASTSGAITFSNSSTSKSLHAPCVALSSESFCMS